MFIGLYCCLLVRVQPLSLAWAGLHDTKSLWALFQKPIVEFWLGYSILYLGTSKFSPQQLARILFAFFLPTPCVLCLRVWKIFHAEWDNSLPEFLVSSPCGLKMDVKVSLLKIIDSKQSGSLCPILPHRKHNTSTFSYTISCQNVSILGRLGRGLMVSNWTHSQANLPRIAVFMTASILRSFPSLFPTRFKKKYWW